MKLTIHNKTRSNITIDSSTGNINGNSSKAFNLTMNELEKLRAKLAELEKARAINWHTSNDDKQDDKAEGATVSMLLSMGLPVSPGVSQHWYVSGITGIDTNDGLTPASPLATLVRLEELLPNEITSTTVVHIGPASILTQYKYAAPSIRARTLSKSLIFIGDGASQAGDSGLAYNLLYTNTTQVGATTTSVATSGSYNAGALVGKTMFISSGVGASQPKTIIANTTTSLTPAFPFDAMTSGTQVQVFEPNVIIDIPDVAGDGEHVLVRGCGTSSMASSTIVGNSPAVYFMNMRFTGTPTGTYAMALQGSRVVFAGVEYVGATTMQIRLENSTLLMGLDIADATNAIDMKCEGAELSIATGSTIRGAGWGFSSLGANSGSFNQSFTEGKIDGFMVTTRGVIFRENATFYIRGGVLAMASNNLRAAVTVRNGARGFIIDQTPSLPIIIDGTHSVGIDVGAISVLDNGKLALSGTVITCIQTGTSAIWVARGGNLEIGVSPTVGVGGVSGYGLVSCWGGIATFQSPAGWTLIGALGEMSVDNHSPFRAVLLTGAGKMAKGPGLIERLG